MYTHLSLNALRILSTSSSRWKADASRLRSFSSSASVDNNGVDKPEPAAGFDDDDDGSEDMGIESKAKFEFVKSDIKSCSFFAHVVKYLYVLHRLSFLRNLYKHFSSPSVAPHPVHIPPRYCGTRANGVKYRQRPHFLGNHHLEREMKCTLLRIGLY